MTWCTSVFQSPLQFASAPFPHAVCRKALPDEVSLELLSWLEARAAWRLVETDFYEQFEFSVWDVELPSGLSFVRSRKFLGGLKSAFEDLFQTRLSDQIDFTAHRLLPGQRIRIHNDFVPGGETHRLVVQLNRKWESGHGGVLMLFGSGNPSSVERVVMPVHNTALAFEISPRSNHAVSVIHGGERFTLVLSFYAMVGQ